MGIPIEVMGAVAAPLIAAGLIAGLAKYGRRRLPILSRTGFDVVLVLLLPAFLVSTGPFNADAIGFLKNWFGRLHLLDWFVTVIVVGSLAEVDLRQLGRTGSALPVPVFGGSLLALGAGTLAGMLAGAKAADALLLGVVPAMAGGIAVGAMPLANGYAKIRDVNAGEMLGLLLPAVVLANLLAILIAALMRKGESDSAAEGLAPLSSPGLPPASLQWHLLALASIVLLQFLAWLGQSFAEVPASLSLIALMILFRLAGFLPERLRLPLVSIYRQSVRWLLFPMLSLVGLLVLPWGSVAAGFAAPTFAAAAAVSLTLALSGRACARWMQMAPNGGGTLFLARAAMGGSGNLTILGAANRMELMPLALLLTRIGGALTVAAALLLMRLL